MSEIRISELKTLFNRVIEKLESEKGKEGKIELETLLIGFI